MVTFKNSGKGLISFSETVGELPGSRWYHVEPGKTVEIPEEKTELLKTARHKNNVEKGLVEVKGDEVLKKVDVEPAEVKKKK